MGAAVAHEQLGACAGENHDDRLPWFRSVSAALFGTGNRLDGRVGIVCGAILLRCRLNETKCAAAMANGHIRLSTLPTAHEREMIPNVLHYHAWVSRDRAVQISCARLPRRREVKGGGG